MLKKLAEKMIEKKEQFESNHGIVAYTIEFVVSVGLTFGSSYATAKATRKVIDKIAAGRELNKATSFILSVAIGFIPAFIGSFISALTMPNERVLKSGIINRERDRRDRKVSEIVLMDISDEELYSNIEGEEA